ncbi:MAG: hypothetical protein ACK4SQ_18225 [Allorhizobium sp.]
MGQGVSHYRDRHGRMRWRYRSGKINISLPGQPGDPAFERAHQSALKGEKPEPIDESLFLRRKAMVEHYARAALKRAANRAKTAGVVFSLTIEDFETMLQRQEWRCAVSMIEFELRRMDVDKRDRAFRPSIDRRIPSAGYTLDNARLVCEIVNLAMNEWGEEPLLKLCELVVANRRG